MAIPVCRHQGVLGPGSTWQPLCTFSPSGRGSAVHARGWAHSHGGGSILASHLGRQEQDPQQRAGDAKQAGDCPATSLDRGGCAGPPPPCEAERPPGCARLRAPRRDSRHHGGTASPPASPPLTLSPGQAPQLWAPPALLPPHTPICSPSLEKAGGPAVPPSSVLGAGQGASRRPVAGGRGWQGVPGASSPARGLILLRLPPARSHSP